MNRGRTRVRGAESSSRGGLTPWRALRGRSGPRRTRGTVALLLCAGVGGCGESGGLGTEGASLTFAPRDVDFGVRELGQRSEARAELVYGGIGTLRITSATFEPPTRFLRALPAEGGASLTGLVLASGRSVPVEVRYAPVVAGVHDTTLVLLSTLGRTELAIRARTPTVSVDRLSIRPSELRFGEVFVGERLETELWVRNDADRTARLTAVDVPSDAFAVLEPRLIEPDAGRLGPGTELAVRLRWSPARSGDFADRLIFRFGAGRQIDVPVRGEVRAAGVLGCPDRVDLGSVSRGRQSARVVRCRTDGGGARLLPIDAPAPFRLRPGDPDPDGIPVEVTVRAEGLPGDVVRSVDLQATDGQSETVELRARVTPPEAQDVQLSARVVWDDDFADLDLHWVRSGAEPFAVGDDCYFLQKNPDWGLAEDRSDDPFLDRDSTSGRFPELVNLQSPKETSYDLYVFYHDFDPVVGDREVGVDVRVDRRGEELGRWSDTLGSCGSILHIASLERSNGEWTVQWIGSESDRFRSLAAFRCR